MADSRKKNRYAYLDQLSTIQLQELLRTEFESSEQADEDEIFYILEVIEQRESAAPTMQLPDESAAWEEFQQYYAIPEGEQQSLYPGEGPGVQADSPSSAGRRSTRGFRRAGMAAAMAAVLLTGMFVVQAVGVDIFGAIGQWTEENFHFKMERAGGTAAEIAADFAENGFDESLAPTWLPDGFEKVGADYNSDKHGETLSLTYSREERDIIIYVQISDSPEYLFGTGVEKDSGVVEEYISNGKLFYIMSNLNSNLGVWSNGQNLSIYISGDIDQEELEGIIDSIGG